MVSDILMDCLIFSGSRSLISPSNSRFQGPSHHLHLPLEHQEAFTWKQSFSSQKTRIHDYTAVKPSKLAHYQYYLYMTHKVQPDNTVSVNILPVCSNVLPGVRPHPLFQNRDICILPPFVYVTADWHSRMKLTEIPKQTNVLVHSNLCHCFPLKDSVEALYLLILIRWNDSVRPMTERYCWRESCVAASWRTKSTNSFGTRASFDLFTMIFTLAVIGFTTGDKEEWDPR
jgi:hypothetical protein